MMSSCFVPHFRSLSILAKVQTRPRTSHLGLDHTMLLVPHSAAPQQPQLHGECRNLQQPRPLHGRPRVLGRLNGRPQQPLPQGAKSIQWYPKARKTTTNKTALAAVIIITIYNNHDIAKISLNHKGPSLIFWMKRYHLSCSISGDAARVDRAWQGTITLLKQSECSGPRASQATSPACCIQRCAWNAIKYQRHQKHAETNLRKQQISESWTLSKSIVHPNPTPWIWHCHW